MTIRGLAILVGVLLLTGCTAGSGRSDAPTTAGAITNIVVSGSGPSGIVTGGAAVNFVMAVTNNGPSAATNFNVFDNVGSGLTLTSITCVASGGAACPATVSVLTAIQQLPAGGTLTFKVAANVGQLVSGTVSNQLSVDVTTNPDHAADSFVATVTVVSADLSVAATPPPGPLPGGSGASFTATVTNNGPATSQNVSITNTLSAGVSAAGAITCAGAGGAVCPTSLGPTMVVPSIPVSGVLTLTIPFTVKPGTNGPVSDTVAVSATTDPRSGNNSATATVGAQSPDLSVSETGSAQVGAGSDAVFTAMVSNLSTSNASNVTVSYSLTGPVENAATVVTCTPSVGAACPATLGPVMTVPTLNASRSLTFKFTVPVLANAVGQGVIVNTVAASINGDPNLANNQASFTSTPINANNGPYELYAANGNKYLMTIDFDAGSYTITGNGQNLQASFSPDPAVGGYRVSDTTRFRLAPNLIVGGQDFGTGVLPYLAGRVFGTNVQQLGGIFGGVYDLMTLNIPVGGGPAVTHAGTAKASGNVMLICQSDTQVYVPQACPAASLHTFSLSVANNVYTGTDTSTQQTYTFQLAIIGATVSLLSAGTAADGSQQLRIGLPDSLFSSRITQGASTTNDWITMTVTPTSYSFTSVLGDSDSAVLAPIISHASAPFSMLVGNRATDAAQIFVMQSYPLSVAFGGFGGLASGLLQVTVP
jgi:hypothetical protein